MEVYAVKDSWVHCHMDGLDFQSTTKYPLHFFDDEDDLGIKETVNSIEAGRALIEIERHTL